MLGRCTCLFRVLVALLIAEWQLPKFYPLLLKLCGFSNIFGVAPPPPLSQYRYHLVTPMNPCTNLKNNKNTAILYTYMYIVPFQHNHNEAYLKIIISTVHMYVTVPFSFRMYSSRNRFQSNQVLEKKGKPRFIYCKNKIF